MQQTRPASVTVIAILNLVFGALWLLCGLGSLGMQASGMQNMFMNMGNVNPSNNPQIAKQEEIRKQVMEFSRKMNSSPLEYASHAQYIVLSILLIISGIGLLMSAFQDALLPDDNLAQLHRKQVNKGALALNLFVNFLDVHRIEDSLKFKV